VLTLAADRLRQKLHASSDTYALGLPRPDCQ
jgi:hypothetical protein